MTTCPPGAIRRSTPYWVAGDALLGQHSVNPCLPRAICASPPTEEPAGQRVVRRFPLPPIRDGGHPSVRLTSEGPSARAGDLAWRWPVTHCELGNPDGMICHGRPFNTADR